MHIRVCVSVCLIFYYRFVEQNPSRVRLMFCFHFIFFVSFATKNAFIILRDMSARQVHTLITTEKKNSLKWMQLHMRENVQVRCKRLWQLRAGKKHNFNGQVLYTRQSPVWVRVFRCILHKICTLHAIYVKWVGYFVFVYLFVATN